MAKVIKQGSGSSDFLLENLQDADMPASYAPGNWDTAFSWGDHAAAGYGLLGSANTWTGSNNFQGDLRIDYTDQSTPLLYFQNRNLSGQVRTGILKASAATIPYEWLLPAASGTVALTDDLLTPGGTANQLQTNDGSGGLAGIPVEWDGLVLSNIPVAHNASFDLKRSDATAAHIFALDASTAASGDIRLQLGRSTDTTGDVIFQMHAGNGTFSPFFQIRRTLGMLFGSPAGGLPGAGKINAEGVQVNGNDAWHSGNLESANLDWTGQHTFTNGLGFTATVNQITNTLGDGANRLLDMDFPNISSVVPTVRFFRGTNTTSAGRFDIYEGDGTSSLTHRLQTKGLNSFVQIQGGNFGIGTTGPSEKLDVNGNARVRGNIIADNAAGHTIGGKAFQYDTETVSLGNDFGSGSGSEVKCVRVGDRVTITATAVLTHTSSSEPLSASGVIPAKYRPSSEAWDVYIAGALGVNPEARNIIITPSGELKLNYQRTDSAASVSDTTSVSPPSITYNV